jgi:hypothetical protein
MPAPLDEGGDALVELTAFGRGNADETVKDPPEGSGATIAQMRRAAGDAVDGPATTDA